MAHNVEDRLAALEQRQLKTIAQVNVLRTMMLSAYSDLIMEKPDPIAFVEEAKRFYTSEPNMPLRQFPGADPAYLDLVSAEYDLAIADFLQLLEAHIHHRVAAKSRRGETD